MNESVQIPEGYERNTDLNHVLKSGEPLLYNSSTGWRLEKVNGFENLTIKKVYDYYEKDYICLIKRKIPLTPEEKIKLIKKQSKQFVDRNITNPTPEVYKNFELAFLKDDARGL